MADYLPKSDAALNSWTNTFDTGLAANAAQLSLSPADEATLLAATDSIRTAIRTSDGQQATARRAVADKLAAVAAAGAIIRPLIKRAKTATGYTEAIGKAMGIIGADTATDWNTYKPVISAETFPGHVTIRFTKKGAQGVNIYGRLNGEGEWTKLAFDGHSPYIDNRPGATPGQSENREYMAIGVVHDTEIGQMSDIISVVFAG